MFYVTQEELKTEVIASQKQNRMTDRLAVIVKEIFIKVTVKEGNLVKNLNEDVLQNTYIVILKNLHKLDATQNLLGYLWATCHSAGCVEARKQKGERKFLEKLKRNPPIRSNNPVYEMRIIKRKPKRINNGKATNITDKVKLKIKESYASGESMKSICRRMKIHITRLRRILLELFDGNLPNLYCKGKAKPVAESTIEEIKLAFAAGESKRSLHRRYGIDRKKLGKLLSEQS